MTGDLGLGVGQLSFEVPVFLHDLIDRAIAATLSLRDPHCAELCLQTADVFCHVLVLPEFVVEPGSQVDIFLISKGVLGVLLEKTLWTGRSPFELACRDVFPEVVPFVLFLSFVSVLIGVMFGRVVGGKGTDDLTVDLEDLRKSLLVHLLLVGSHIDALINAPLRI